MIERNRRDRVGIGLIGLGANWDGLFRETICRMQSRLIVRLIYDVVEARAKSVATELGAEGCSSLRQMFLRSTLQGLLVFDLGWCKTGALDLIAHCGKPIYLAENLLRQPLAVRTVVERRRARRFEFEQTPQLDDFMMPELALRYTPATCRLRELIATKLGAVQGIEIHVGQFSEIMEAVRLIDWCSHIMEQQPVQSSASSNGSVVGARVQLEYRGTSSNSVHRFATITQTIRSNVTSIIEVNCDNGTAQILDRARIEWKTSTETAAETLVDERSEFEASIDQFCRRAVGGLNPVGRLSDYLNALDIAERFC